MKETSDLHQLDAKDKHAAVVYLWKSRLHFYGSPLNRSFSVHNHVNQRLHGDETEDPKHPKVQFPSEHLCPKCRLRGNEFNIPATITFLRRYFSKENLDTTAVENYVQTLDQNDPSRSDRRRKASIDQYSMIEINTDAKRKSGLVRFLVTSVQRFPLYFLISFLIVAFLARRRYCRAKRKRYTL
jgi:hypothetical protein